MKNIFRKLISTVAVFTVVVFSATPVMAAQVRDNDSNAIIYGGAYSIAELNQKLDNGTGKPYQSSAQLKALFSAYGINQADFGQLKDGYVNKKNQVIVNGVVVASDVYTMGRHNISGSTADNRFGYPLFVRHPSVSFVSDNLQAFVSINYDGSYAYAILKPCGNIVTGPGYKVKPVIVPKPAPKPTPTPVPIPKTIQTPKPVITPAPKPTVIKASKENTNLPQSGPAEAAAGAAGITFTSSAAYAWLRSKKKLTSALRKF